jgi:UDP-N-acetylmuramoyl-tripeptide--D-alanyl-D-alanine ligase
VTRVSELVWGATAVLAIVGAAPKWLRIAQREHYQAPATTRFAWRWWTATRVNVAIAVAGAVLALTTVYARWLVCAVAVLVVVAPLGLSLRGRSSPLSWTRRLRTTAAVLVAVNIAVVAAAFLLATSATAMVWAALLLVQPMVVDLVLTVLAPFERRTMARFVQGASRKLRAVAPTTVAITGSYGKTTTKNYLRHLVAGTRTVLASPASFNNTGGLARTMNEHLTPGTDVLIAEMGTYGPGEITGLCRWVKPDVAAIVNIGPIHLERMGSLDTIVAAKAEIFADVATCVLNVDAHGLAALADQLQGRGKRVLRASCVDRDADVCVEALGHGWTVLIEGSVRATVVQSDAHPDNVACAVALAVALDVPISAITSRLESLPSSEHRQQVSVAASGVTVIDNTFSSNPASAASSLRRLLELCPTGRRIVVTPGMVELGSEQRAANQRFGAEAACVASDVVIVGRTNRAALAAGTDSADAQVHLVDDRRQAVAWVRAHGGPTDAVLYEGDLPDHYP